MPKSYLPDEPGARRGVQHGFDPYEQVSSRLSALTAVGHPTDKIELLILGGTWDAYPRDYQEWFVRRCFDAMNGIESARSGRSASGQREQQPSQCRIGDRNPSRPDHP